MHSFVVGSLMSLALLASMPALAQEAAPASRPKPMVLSTEAFADGGQIPVEFTQAAPGVTQGGGTSPALTWSDAPEGTQSFVLHMHDLDVARNGTTDDQLHWLVWNIPATATSLPEAAPAGSPMADGSLQTSVSGPMYRGPGAPANGPFHHYVFELFALDGTLSVQPSEDAFATRTDVVAAMQGHILGKAVYSGLFRRPE